MYQHRGIREGGHTTGLRLVLSILGFSEASSPVLSERLSEGGSDDTWEGARKRAGCCSMAGSYLGPPKWEEEKLQTCEHIRAIDMKVSSQSVGANAVTLQHLSGGLG